ncbi:hypothetical protein J6590_001778 [Homalodisca vitripennis]|nr:hypothetical protein J6590_001778 [Homalodisca vitripennis]
MEDGCGLQISIVKSVTVSDLRRYTERKDKKKNTRAARRGSDVRINALAALSNTTKLPAVQQKPVQYRSINTKFVT